MIKKTLTGLFIGLVGIINFSFAQFTDSREYTLTTVMDYETSTLDSNIIFTVLPYGNFKSEKGGVEKNVLAFASKTQNSKDYYIYYFWTNDKKPYYLINYANPNSYYGGKWYKQGYLKNYYVCNEGYSTGFDINNCIAFDLNSDAYYEYMSQILGTIKATDEFWYYVGIPTLHREGDNNAYCTVDTSTFSSTICMNSNQLNKSICFSNTSYYTGGRYNSGVPENCKPIDFDNLTGSIGLLYNTDILDIPSSYIGTAPTSNGGIQQGERNNNNYFCPTIGQILNNYDMNYNTGLCYNSTLNYENGQITTMEKKDIFTIFENYEEFTNRTSIYYNNCSAPNTTENCQNAFSGQRYKRNIIANAKNVKTKELWNYCNLSLNYDPNISTCVASGYTAEQPTLEEFGEMIMNGEITKITTPGTGNILNGLLGSGQTREDISTRDILGQLDQLKEKIGSIFEERSGKNGIIPDYIMWLILTTLLLTVLLKK